MKRLDDRGRVDHDHSFEFTYDGRALTAHPGDTLASALLANDVRVLGTSVLMSRPRGVVTDNVTDPHAIVQVGTGIVTEPLMRANELEVFPGFEATGRLHQGILPTAREDTRFEKRFAHCDVLVVGAGPTGLGAALAAADAGARVILVDDHPHLGGALLGSGKLIDNQPAAHWVADAEARLRANPDVTVLTRTTAFNNGDQGAVALMERVTEHLPESKRGHCRHIRPVAGQRSRRSGGAGPVGHDGRVHAAQYRLHRSLPQDGVEFPYRAGRLPVFQEISTWKISSTGCAR